MARSFGVARWRAEFAAGPAVPEAAARAASAAARTPQRGRENVWAAGKCFLPGGRLR